MQSHSSVETKVERKLINVFFSVLTSYLAQMKRHTSRKKKASSSTAAKLTDDILTNILSRLPIKTLMQFKCVSKHWRALISGNHFAKVHLQSLSKTLSNDTSLQRIVKTSPLQTIDYEALDGSAADARMVVKSHDLGGEHVDGHQRLVGSCNGLVCLMVYDGFLLYNPTTKESRNLSGSTVIRGVKDLESYKFGDHVEFYGFGYDSAVDDYKIVLGGVFTAHDGSKECRVELYSLRSNSWKKIQSEGTPSVHGPAVYLNNAVHWCAYEDRGDKEENAIVSFDFAEEKVHEILPVPEVEEGIRFEGLGIHGTKLFIHRGTWHNVCEAWVMNEYGKGESWTKLFTVSTDCIPGCRYWIIPLARTKSGKIVVQVDVCQIFLCDPSNPDWEESSKAYPIEYCSDVESAVYIETLVSPFLGMGSTLE